MHQFDLHSLSPSYMYKHVGLWRIEHISQSKFTDGVIIVILKIKRENAMKINFSLNLDFFYQTPFTCELKYWKHVFLIRILHFLTQIKVWREKMTIMRIPFKMILRSRMYVGIYLYFSFLETTSWIKQSQIFKWLVFVLLYAVL